MQLLDGNRNPYLINLLAYNMTHTHEYLCNITEETPIICNEEETKEIIWQRIKGHSDETKRYIL